VCFKPIAWTVVILLQHREGRR